MKLIVYSDGGSRGNPGKAAVGALVYLDCDLDKPILILSQTLGFATNNVAEYQAILKTLKLLLKNNLFTKTKNVDWYLDSKLVVEQLSGHWKIKDEKMRFLSQKINSLIKKNQLVIKFIHIPREKNQAADRLVNQALDGVS